MTRLAGIGYIFGAAFVSFFIAITADTSKMELGALTLFIQPPLIALVSMLLFLIVTLLTQDRTTRIIAVIILCLYNLYVATALHIGKDHWPLVG
jgi:hypothetical protein